MISFFVLLTSINTGNGLFMVKSAVALVVLAARHCSIQMITPSPDVAGIM